MVSDGPQASRRVAEMKAATSSKRPGQEPPGSRGCSHRNDKGMRSKADLSFAEKGADPGSCESQRNDGILENAEGSQSTGAITRQSQVAKRSRHKRWRSPGGSLDNRHKENGQWEEKGWGGPSPAQGRREDQPDCAREGRPGRRGAAHSPRRLKDRRIPRPRSPVRTTGPGRRPDSREARPASPKRRRLHLGPDARDPLAAVTTRLWHRVGALKVALEELRAPGGAFLPVPTRCTQPSASQRAWLSWQLAHAGATLHWAAARLHTPLAAQPLALGAHGALASPLVRSARSRSDRRAPLRGRRPRPHGAHRRDQLATSSRSAGPRPAGPRNGFRSDHSSTATRSPAQGHGPVFRKTAREDEPAEQNPSVPLVASDRRSDGICALSSLCVFPF
ncbi:serine/arginine repetitive matrix protein 1-like [Zalophus californianus]|uniref:Serine/arginine repetitive matrix protein 1-like n=1 Tax=Zalophus californianus TaxID=9704 RepID=A0A6J2EY16_ZALCA|nr:serine/arginine repetitive matrix protein 1-like [Zalophus californianus]